MRRDLVRSLIALGLVASFAGGAHAQSNGKITVAVGGKTIIAYLPLPAAYYHGDFKAEGLDVIFKRAGFDWREAGCSIPLEHAAIEAEETGRWQANSIARLKRDLSRARANGRYAGVSIGRAEENRTVTVGAERESCGCRAADRAGYRKR